MAPPIKFYFDFVSAYSYVAMNRIDQIAARWGGKSNGIACRCPGFWLITARPRRAISRPSSPIT